MPVDHAPHDPAREGTARRAVTDAPAAGEQPPPYSFPLPLLVCVAATVAVVGSAGSWESATGVSFWVWLACGLVPLVAGAMIHRRFNTVVFLGSRPEVPGVRRPGRGAFVVAILLVLVPRIVGDGVAGLVTGSGAGALPAAGAATAVVFAAVLLGYRAAEKALNRRDAAAVARRR